MHTFEAVKAMVDGVAAYFRPTSLGYRRVSAPAGRRVGAVDLSRSDLRRVASAWRRALGSGFVSCFLLVCGTAWGAPAAIPYVGHLSYAGTGAPYNGTLASVQAVLWASANPQPADQPVWSGSWTNLGVQSGVFQLVLSGASGDPLDSTTISDHPGGLWLELTLNGAPLAPLQAIQSVPYALLAADAEQLGGVDAAEYVVQSAQGDVSLAGHLNVGGPLQLGTTSTACGSANEGSLRYDSVGHRVEFCNGIVWGALGAGNTCVDPSADLTLFSYTHYGNGNCAPHIADQRYMSDNSYASGDYGWHFSCGVGPSAGNPAYAAIRFPTPVVVSTLRILLHTNPAKNLYLQGSNNTTNGVDGTWTTLHGPVDLPSGQELQWWSASLPNVTAYSVYRLYTSSSPAMALYEWEMFCGN